MESVNETFFGCLPRSVADLRTEAYLPVIIPWFMKSLDIPGDVCEFGCFRGTMSIKFAYALRAFCKTQAIQKPGTGQQGHAAAV